MVELCLLKNLLQYYSFLTDPLQNRIVILNSAKAPTDELTVRKLIIHGVNKAAIIDRELAGLAEPVDTLFPKTAPYCHVDLTPRWDYDLEKANFLRCPQSSAVKVEEKTDWAATVGIVAAVAVAMGLIGVALFFFGRTTGFRAAMAVYRDKRDSPIIENQVVGNSSEGEEKPEANV